MPTRSKRPVTGLPVVERLAVDTNAVIHALRSDRPTPPHIAAAQQVMIPLPVLAELYIGALLSELKEENRAAIENLASAWTLLPPDRPTAGFYAELASAERVQARSSPRHERARRNDLWIAALCVQHELPLLSNDRDFDGINGLEVIHW